MKNGILKKIFDQDFHFFMSIPALMWQVLFFYIPLMFVIAISFIKTTERALAFTLENYHSLLNPIYFIIIARSFFLAFVTASLCLLCAYPIAYFIVFKMKRFKNSMLFFLILPFWISLLIQVYAWFFVLEKYGIINRLLIFMGVINEPLPLLNTPFAIYLVMIYCYLPFMILPLYTILEKMDRRLIEASLDLGANQEQTFTRVTLPLSLSGIQTGFFLVFVPSFGEFVIPGLMGGGKQYYVGSLILHYFLIARQPFLGAAFTCLSGAFLGLVVYIVYWCFKKISG